MAADGSHDQELGRFLSDAAALVAWSFGEKIF
jgi:hypothetical protein